MSNDAHERPRATRAARAKRAATLLVALLGSPAFGHGRVRCSGDGTLEVFAGTDDESYGATPRRAAPIP